MEEEKDFEERIERAFQQTKGPLPEEKYFKKIWDSIEFKAPVGERFYLRPLFSIFLVLIFVAVFLFFYADFLSSALTLRQIRQENLRSRRVTSSLITAPVGKLEKSSVMQISPGVSIKAVTDTLLQLSLPQGHVPVLELLNGHLMAEIVEPGEEVLLRMPDLDITLPRGRYNLFYYDGIIRVIPLTGSLNIRLNGEARTVGPGETFFLLDE